MRIVPGFIIREIAGETIAVPAGEAARCLSGLAALNGSGKLLFELLRQPQTEASLTAALVEAYEVDQVTAEADVKEFLELLRSKQMLLEDDE